MKKLGITTVAFSKNETLLNELNKFVNLEFFPNPNLSRLSKTELVDFLKDKDAAIIGLDQINESILKNTPKLKYIIKYGVGLDNIDFNACDKFGVKVMFSKGVNKLSVAELTLGMILSLIRNVYVSSNHLKNGQWLKKGGTQLSEKTIGIVGLGNIGREVLRLIEPFNCNVLMNDIIDLSFIEDVYKNCKQVSLDYLIKNSDVITLHLPNNESTFNLFDKNKIQSMKKGSILINTARGEILDHEALKIALLNNHLGGAAIDVYEVEPPNDKDLLSIPNLINTPHIGGNSSEAVLAMGYSSIENLKSINWQ